MIGPLRVPSCERLSAFLGMDRARNTPQPVSIARDRGLVPSGLCTPLRTDTYTPGMRREPVLRAITPEPPPKRQQREGVIVAER